MSAALLAQIYASPEDDALRQVYGDWLIERDDPRGEFIALQFKQARGVATAEDDRRVAALLREHWWPWAGNLAGAIHRPESRFEKGFLSTVKLGKASTPKKVLRQIVGDETWATVRHLEPAHIMGSYAKTVIHPVMKALRSVFLDHDHLPTICAGPVPWSIQALQLRAWILKDQHLTAIAECPGFASLEHLALSTGGESDEVMRRVLPAKICERLQRLTLSLRGHSAAMESVVAALSCDSAIETLAVELNYFGCAATRHATGVRSIAVVLRDSNEHAIALVTSFLAAARSAFSSCSLAHGSGVIPTRASEAFVRGLESAVVQPRA